MLLHLPGRAAVTVLLVFVLAPAAAAAPGDIDPSFGTDGIATIGPPAGVSPVGVPLLRAGGTSSDRRLVYAVPVSGLKSVYVTSLNSSGALVWQKTVTGSSVPIVDANLGDELRLQDLATAGDGRTALLARHGTGTAAVVVFKPDGSFDTSFDGDGKLNIAINGFGPMTLAFQPDGKLIVGSSGTTSPNSGFEPGLRLHRFTVSGAPDSTFGSNGVVDAPPPPCCAEEPAQLIVSSTSITVLGRRRLDTASAGAFLRRFTSAGVLDPAVDEALPVFGSVAGLAIDSSSRYVVVEAVGVPADQGSSDIVMIRRLSNGDSDAAFGPSGQRSVAVRAPTAARTLAFGARDMAAAPGSKIVVAGSVFPSSGAFVTRLGPDGAIDTAFGPAAATTQAVANVATVDVGLYGGMAVQSDGRIVVAGGSGASAKLARMLVECTVFTCQIAVSQTTTSAVVSSQLLQTSNVGILVKRRVGTRLVSVGRVPFGVRKKGRNRIAWNLKVNGKRLSPGTYEITLRALDATGRVVDLSRPARLVVRG